MKIITRAFSAVALLAMALSALGQDRKPLSGDEQSQYLVSAKAGAVNIVDGDASFKRGKSDWDTLIAGDELRAGDAVKTGSDGRVEVLLSPGSFLRLAGDSEFLFSSTSVYNLRLKVVTGSIIVEASAVESPIIVNAGQSRFSIVRNGVYRFTTENGHAVATVRKGRLLFADNTVKDGKKIVVLAGGTPMITSFDKKAEDEFDTWSRDRAKTLIAANRKLSERTIRRSLSWGGGGNLWLYDPFFRTYTFLPFGYGYNSPYGGGYRTCNPYYNPWRNNPNGGTIGGGSGSGYGGGSGSGGGSGTGGSTGGTPTGSGGSYQKGSDGGGSFQPGPASRNTGEATSKGRIN
jgi:hypothetical protein